MVKRLSAIFLALMLCVAAFALPASAAYTYEDTELGFSLTLPDEFDGVVELREGTVDTSGAGSAGPHSASRTVDAGDGRHYLISASWDGEAADETDAAMAYIVNQILESFTLWDGHPEILA